MKKENVGLLSLSNAENYGAVLQCYSLFHYCKKINNNVSVINYWPAFMEGRYKLFWIEKGSIRKLVSSFKYSLECLPYTFLKKIKFYLFRMKYLYNLPVFKTRTISDTYAAYIVGSDQVWNTDITQNDMTFFLDFVLDNNKKNSYAASLGIEKYSDQDEKDILCYLEEFNKISVREKQGRNYLNQLDERLNVFNHIDPVFLTSIDEWMSLCKKKLYKKPYILIYSFNNIDFSIDLAKKISIAENWDIIIIRADKNKYYRSIRCFRTVGPNEFLTLIKDAMFIITDSFHGTAFSLIFNKQFYTIPFKGTNSRIENILNIFKCSDRLVTVNDRIDLHKKIDYSEFNVILKAEQKKSKSYLESILRMGSE